MTVDGGVGTLTELSSTSANGKSVAGSQRIVVVGIPAFNEEKTIARVVLLAMENADAVVVCDDGSTDLTAKIAGSLGAIVIRHERRMGYGAAIQSLFRRAREINADVLVTLDADGQHDPTEIPRIVKPLTDGAADIVVGSRLARDAPLQAMPWFRRAGIRIITRLANGRSNGDPKDGQSGFRAYDRRCIDTLGISENGMGVSSEILINAKKESMRICEVPIRCQYGNGLKTSKQNSLAHGLGVVTSITKLVVEDRPIMMLGLPGVLLLTVGIVFGVWMLQIYASEHHIVTNIALASISFIMIGFFALSTAITLYGIKRAIEKIHK